MYAGIAKKNRVKKTQGDSIGACLIEEGMTYSLD